MAIAFVDHGVGHGGSGAALAIVCPATVNPDDLLIAVGGLASTTDFGTNPAGWSDLGTTTQAGSIRGRFWYKVAVGTEDGSTVNFPNGSSQDKIGLIARYSGVNSLDVLDATGTPVGDGGEPYEASVTVVENDSTVVLMMFIDGTSGVNEANATFTGTGGITFRARYYDGGDLVVIGDGVFNAGSHTVGFNSDAADNNTRNAVLQAISLNPGSSAQALTPGLYTNTQTFYSATVSVGAVDLTPDLYTNSQTFFEPTVTTSYQLTPELFTNSQTFYEPTVSVGAITLTPNLFTNTNQFYTATITVGGVTLTPDLFTNTTIFYTPTVSPGTITLTPDLFTNTQIFYNPTVTGGIVTLLPSLFTNNQTFFEHMIEVEGAPAVSGSGIWERRRRRLSGRKKH